MFNGHYTPPNNMVDYPSRPIILPNMKAIGPPNSEQLHSQSLKSLKSFEPMT